MKLKYKAIQKWLDLRSTRENILIFLAGFALIYLLWNLLFELPLHNKKTSLMQSNQRLLTELSVQKQNLNAIEHIIASSSFAHNLQQQQQLNNKSNVMAKQLRNLQSSFVPVEWLAQMTNDLIAQQAEVDLVSVKTFVEEPWLKTKSTISDYFYNMQGNIYKHSVEIECHGTYFNVIAFLEHLEKLPWHFYWDHLDYKVTVYPEARAVVRFYVLTNQKE